MKGKVIVILICMLFLFSNTTTFASDLNDVIIVDDEGDGDYTSIKEALSYANPGDTIEVYSGTYYENNITINIEGINLQGISYELGNGNDTGKPFIDGPGTDPYSLIEIIACDTTINGFHIENYNSEPLGNVLITIYHEADGCVISNNDIFYTSSTLIWVYGSNNIIMNNNISHSLMRQGICLKEPATNNIVRGNVISDCEDGILCWGSNLNLIEGNNIHNCERFGIDITYKNSILRYNTIENNTIGLYLRSKRVIVSNNNFINNEEHAIGTYGTLRQFISNRWIGNYWGEERTLPYPIPCYLFILPLVQFDWRPASVPNEI